MNFYKCEHCGNIIAYIHDSGVRAKCCGEEMKHVRSSETPHCPHCDRILMVAGSRK